MLVGPRDSLVTPPLVYIEMPPQAAGSIGFASQECPPGLAWLCRRSGAVGSGRRRLCRARLPVTVQKVEKDCCDWKSFDTPPASQEVESGDFGEWFGESFGEGYLLSYNLHQR